MVACTSKGRPMIAVPEIVENLRGRIRGLEKSRRGPGEMPLSTGWPPLDGLLPGGGLRRGSLVEWLAAGPGSGAATLQLEGRAAGGPGRRRDRRGGSPAASVPARLGRVGRGFGTADLRPAAKRAGRRLGVGTSVALSGREPPSGVGWIKSTAGCSGVGSCRRKPAAVWGCWSGPARRGRSPPGRTCGGGSSRREPQRAAGCGWSCCVAAHAGSGSVELVLDEWTGQLCDPAPKMGLAPGSGVVFGRRHNHRADGLAEDDSRPLSEDLSEEQRHVTHARPLAAQLARATARPRAAGTDGARRRAL